MTKNQILSALFMMGWIAGGLTAGSRVWACDGKPETQTVPSRQPGSEKAETIDKQNTTATSTAPDEDEYQRPPHHQGGLEGRD